jgi:beta-lactamase regulating signal transducer with metallopeptidase domain
MLSAVLHVFSQQAADVAVTAVWQGACIAGALAILLRLAPRTSAEHRFYLWAAAFAALVGLPLLSLISNSAASRVAGTSSIPISSGFGSGPWLSVDSRWSMVIAALWAVATVFRASDLILHSFRLRKLWKDAIPVELDSRVSCALSPAAAGLRAPVQVCTTTTLQRPSVIGFFKPRILIPDWLFARLTPGELEQIVLHEAEHLRRRDDWTNLFQKLCLVLFPLNPALHWIEHRLCREREMACDEGVIRITHAPRAYAACLASLAERGLQRRAEALSLGAWQRRPELVRRVHSILRGKHTLGPLGTRALMGALGCSLLFGSIELARCPQLVAFVPARNQVQNPNAARAGASFRRPAASPRLLNTAYVPARSRRGDRSSTALHATTVAASVTAASQGFHQSVKVSKQRTSTEEFVAVLSTADAQTPRPVHLKAEMPGAQSDPVQAQQWIVLTTWEQVQTPNQSSNLIADYEIADYESGASAKASAGDQTKIAKNGQSGTQLAGQMTVTRLILRIVPASSFPTQPAIVPMRNGWLVLQL